MKNFGKILSRKFATHKHFSSKKPQTGSQLFSMSFGDVMNKSMPMVKPSTKPPASSKKEDNSWTYDKQHGVFMRFQWVNGKPYKQFKAPSWLNMKQWTA